MQQSSIITKVISPSEVSINVSEALNFVKDERFGATDIFIGSVRSCNRNREVIAVEYDIFKPLALRKFEEIADAVMAQYGPLLKIYLAHAYGKLQVGDIAVVVAVGSKHRHEAFVACREVIEAVKHRSPIWKREFYVDGETEWSEGCSLCTDNEIAAPSMVSTSCDPPAIGDER